jgi:hypothetical protein
MFAYTDSTCNGGSMTDAFQYVAKRGVTADDGEPGRKGSLGDQGVQHAA